MLLEDGEEVFSVGRDVGVGGESRGPPGEWVTLDGGPVSVYLDPSIKGFDSVIPRRGTLGLLCLS